MLFLFGNLSYALANNVPDIGNIRETVFFSTMKATYPIVTSSVSDFSIGNYTFEIGGKNKTQKQVRDVEIFAEEEVTAKRELYVPVEAKDIYASFEVEELPQGFGCSGLCIKVVA